jgi:predicted adenine nucleotide alpha hydrolase (AANH) superfamily ATPase
MKGSLLLHVCCAPDATVGFERLGKDWNVVGYFFNPNIYPSEEYAKRLEDFLRLGDLMGVETRVGEYCDEEWYEVIKGWEDEPEGGKRCKLCFRYRLRNTAELAQQGGFDAFATVLTVSPHKDAEKINDFGKALGEEFQVEYLATNLKKQDGFKRSVEMSKQFGLYRQNYCGCEFSLPVRNTQG